MTLSLKEISSWQHSNNKLNTYKRKIQQSKRKLKNMTGLYQSINQRKSSSILIKNLLFCILFVYFNDTISILQLSPRSLIKLMELLELTSKLEPVNFITNIIDVNIQYRNKPRM